MPCRSDLTVSPEDGVGQVHAKFSKQVDVDDRCTGAGEAESLPLLSFSLSLVLILVEEARPTGCLLEHSRLEPKWLLSLSLSLSVPVTVCVGLCQGLEASSSQDCKPNHEV